MSSLTFNHKTCNFPLWKHGQRTTAETRLFCGKPVWAERNKGMCEEHHKRCYVPGSAFKSRGFRPGLPQADQEKMMERINQMRAAVGLD